MSNHPALRPTRSGEAGSIPLVLLVSIIVAGLLVALFVDVRTGIRLAANDRDFNQAVQVADAGLQEAFTVLARLDEADMPPIGEIYDGGAQAGALGAGDYAWTARRVGTNRWQVRSEGQVNDVERALEASMGPENYFGLAAFGDLLIELRGGNKAYSYNGTVHNNGRGTVGSNNNITLRGNSTVDWVARYANATYNEGGIIRDGGGFETGPYQNLPDLGSFAYNDDGVCAGGPFYDNITDAIAATGPLTRGEVYCVAQARFPAGMHPVVDNDDDALNSQSAKIYVAVSGNLELLGQGNDPDCTKVACVNYHPDDGDTPDATKLEIFLAGGGGEVLANNHTVIAAGIYAPLSNCSGPNAQGDVYGSIVCRTLDSKGGWTFHYDERFDDVDAEFFAIFGIREETPNTTSFG
jgi:hypothetical protein